MLNLILTFLLWIVQPVEQLSGSQIDPIISAIQNGSSDELSKFFNPTIAMNINGQQGDYSKNQAEIILKDFFKKNPPIDFSIVFKNENQNSISTYIGGYSSGQNSYKVFIKVLLAGNNFRIYSLDFVKS